MGSIAFRWLTGKAPFDGIQLRAEYDPCSVVADLDLCQPLLDFFRRSMTVDIAGRFQQVDEFRTALEQALTAQLAHERQRLLNEKVSADQRARQAESANQLLAGELKTAREELGATQGALKTAQDKLTSKKTNADAERQRLTTELKTAHGQLKTARAKAAAEQDRLTGELRTAQAGLTTATQAREQAEKLREAEKLLREESERKLREASADLRV